MSTDIAISQQESTQRVRVMSYKAMSLGKRKQLTTTIYWTVVQWYFGPEWFQWTVSKLLRVKDPELSASTWSLSLCFFKPGKGVRVIRTISCPGTNLRGKVTLFNYRLGYGVVT